MSPEFANEGTEEEDQMQAPANELKENARDEQDIARTIDFDLDEEEEEDTKLSFKHKKVARAAKIGYPTKMWQAKTSVTS